ncbi:DUF397 domain-containing protein [Streptomyces sp. ISL-12]|uniref:DUF397 domain-containing protein n=1 Tax=Streptomyces sp. ISL-12 TaxID=2819177 RepID=UPI001BE6648A|nr:DUF397 domain-containing protein [Streptomyces sp. ISL-12]MBT2410774.1 DUF397 domain-containing protein [Streptomyces sp. ISL-12]
MTEMPQLHWFKSSYSGGSGTECVECALGDSATLIRDSKCKNGRTLYFQPSTWLCFIQAINRRELTGTRGQDVVITA